MILPMIAVAILVATAVLVSNVIQFSKFNDATIENDLNQSVLHLSSEIALMKSKSHIAAVLVANDKNIVLAMKTHDREALLSRAAQLFETTEMDFITILDMQGIVLARGHAPDLYGDDLSAVSSIKRAIDGTHITTLVRTVQPVLRQSADSDPLRTVGIFVASGIAIADEQGELLGVLAVGFRLDSNEFMDRQKNLSGNEYTLFVNNECVATTIDHDDGTRAMHTFQPDFIRQAASASDTAVERWRSGGRDIIGKHLPLLDINGEVIGVLTVAKYLTDSQHAVRSFITVGSLVVFILLLICMPILWMVTKYIAAPIKKRLAQVHYDSLTGIYNRRYFNENIKRVLGSLSRSGGTLSLMMIDIDFFKKYNDTYGHNEGDRCLKIVAKTLSESVKRADDFVARYGGEEFVVVLPNTDENGARIIAGKLLENIRHCGITHEKNEAAACVTISIGVAIGIVTHTQSGEHYIKCADDMLYESKKNGRNRYSLAALTALTQSSSDVSSEEHKQRKKLEKTEGLFGELERLVQAGKTGDFNIILSADNLSPVETEAIRLLNEASNNFRNALEYDIMKYKLTSEALNIALWDTDVVSGNLLEPNNKYKWSQEFRHMLGFTDENDFPNELHSWSDRLHPDDKERTLEAILAHVNDHTRKTPYNIEYRLMLQEGEYRYFHAFGTTQRDSAGYPLRVAGGLRDITERKQIKETLKRHEELLLAVNRVAEILLTADIEHAMESFTLGLAILESCLDVDRVHIWRNEEIDGIPCFVLKYQWLSDTGRQKPEVPVGLKFSVSDVPEWEEILLRGECINAPLADLPQHYQDRLHPYAIQSLAMFPMLQDNELIGFFSIDNCRQERTFTPDELDLLRSTGLMLTSFFNRQEQSKKLHEAEERTKLMLDSTPLCCQLWDSNLQTIDCNEAAVRLYGYKNKQEYIERFFMECLPEYQPNGERSLEKAMMLVNKAFDEGRCVFEWMHQLPDGTPIPAEVTLVRVRHKEGFVVVGYTRDLREMREAEERIKLMLNATPLSCELWDKEARIIDCNEETVRFFGVQDKQEIIDQIFNFSPEYQPDGMRSQTKVEMYNRRAFAEGRAVFHWTHQLRDGTLIPVEVTLVKIKYRGEDAVAAYSRDLREYNRMMAEIENSLLAAQEANRAKSDFLSRMSHEMLTPMNAIMGMTQILIMRNRADELRTYLQEINTSSHHLLRLINDLLDISGKTNGAFALNEAEFSLTSMLSEVRHSLNRDIQEKQQNLTCNIDSNMPDWIIGDEKRLAQVLRYLLSNAIKFSPDHSEIQLSVETLSSKTEELQLQITVSDNGIGISQDQQKNIFDVFVQVDGSSSRKYDGTGLGLPMARRIIELMGGKIWVESEPDQGAKFTFTCKLRNIYV
jgi:diguanylate cyclase (GGDEF)-like protein/PAS domain S-box-containing protein